MTNDRLSALDTSFLYLESPTTPMHISSLAIYEGPAPVATELRDVLASRMHLVPRFRQRVRTVPLNQHRPMWADDWSFDLEAHLRHVQLPEQTDEELTELVGRLLSIPLDRSRPLWEMWLIDGLPERRFAILAKTHHALWDGITGADLHAVLLDATPDPAETAPEPWTPQPPRSSVDLLAEGVGNRLGETIDLMRSARGVLSDPRRALGKGKEILNGALEYARASFKPAPPTPLNAPIGSRRRFERVITPLGDLKAVGKTYGATVNDVVLSVVAGALREWMIERDVVPQDMKVMVPVSVRARSERGTGGNRLVMFIVTLPVGEEEPMRRLRRVHETMEGEKASKQVRAQDTVTALAAFAPPQVVAQLTKIQSMNRWFNLLVTNIPGPQFPLYVRGRRLLELYPQAPLATNQALAIAAMSYDGKMGFGLLGDRDLVPDIDRLGVALSESIDELVARVPKLDDTTEIPMSVPIPANVGR